MKKLLTAGRAFFVLLVVMSYLISTTLALAQTHPTIFLDKLKTITLNNINQLKELVVLKKDYPANSLSFSPDGTLLAAGYSDDAVRVWNVKTGREEFTFLGHKSSVNSISFSPDGKRVASGGSMDRTAQIWDVKTGKNFAVLHIDSLDQMNSVSFGSAGKSLAYAIGGHIYLWDTVSQSQQRVIETEGARVSNVIFSQDGKLMAYSAGDGDSGGIPTIVIWDVAAEKQLYSLTGHLWTITAIAFAPYSDLLGSSSLDGTIRMWDL
jgi:WD40 repeat protein